MFLGNEKMENHRRQTANGEKMARLYAHLVAAVPQVYSEKELKHVVYTC